MKQLCQPGPGQDFFGLLSLASFAYFLGTAQPFGSGAGTSDGGGLWRLARGGVLATRSVAILALTGASNAGVRPRDWPAEIIDQSLVPSDGSPWELAALLFGAAHAGDRGESARATDFASRAWELGEKHPKLLGGVAVTLGFVAALQADAPQARRGLAHANVQGLEDYAKLWADAELAALDGRPDESRAKARAGIAALERARFASPSARERERLQWLAEG